MVYLSVIALLWDAGCAEKLSKTITQFLGFPDFILPPDCEAELATIKPLQEGVEEQ